MRTPLIKTVNPVMIDPMQGISKVVYFDSSTMVIDEQEVFKDQIGCVTFIVRMMEKLPDNTFAYLPTIEPKQAKYKLSTYLTILDVKPSELIAEKSDLMIQQIAVNSNQYWGLTASDLEIV